MKETPEDRDVPRWLRLAATLRAEPAPDTLARVRRRLVAPALAPAWLRWLARPVAVAASAGLLVVSALAGSAWLAGTTVESADASAITSELLGDDGSFGLGVDRGSVAGTATADSQEVTP